MNQQMAAGGAGPVGQTRNPVTILLISLLCAPYALISLWGMLTELKNFLRNDSIQPWHLLIPYYNMYVLWVQVPKWVTEAKQRAGATNPQSAGFIMYFLVAPYALAGDLNEVWNPRGQLPAGAQA
jgi:hypothetical protein